LAAQLTKLQVSMLINMLGCQRRNKMISTFKLLKS
jgi:hypothetical protein